MWKRSLGAHSHTSLDLSQLWVCLNEAGRNINIKVTHWWQNAITLTDWWSQSKNRYINMYISTVSDCSFFFNWLSFEEFEYYSWSTNNQDCYLNYICKHTVAQLQKITSTTCSNASHWWKNKPIDCLCFNVHTIWYRVEKRSSCDIFNRPPIHINLVGITGRCGRSWLAMTVLQGWVLWVCCMFVCRGGAVRPLLASLVNGFHQHTGRLKKWNRVIHLVQLPLQLNRHTDWIVRKCYSSECTTSAMVVWDCSLRKLNTTI